jgi:hypothetical protein
VLGPSRVAVVPRPRVYASTCIVDGCDRPHHAGGYCSGHHARVRKHGEPGPAELRPRGVTGCSIEGCDRPHKARGLCRAHYQRQLVHGGPGPAEVGRYGGGTCSVDGCERAAHSRGL